MKITVAVNDEHEPYAYCKRTPIMPYIGRAFAESELSSYVKAYLAAALIRCGFDVCDLNPECTSQDEKSRISQTFAVKTNAIVSVGCGAYGSGNAFSDANGYSVCYADFTPHAPSSRALGEEIYAALSSFRSGRGVRREDGAMLSKTYCPSVLVRCLYMTNFDEAKLMPDPDFQKELAERIAKGICAYFDVPYKPENEIASDANIFKRTAYLLRACGKNVIPSDKITEELMGAIISFRKHNGLSGGEIDDELLSLLTRVKKDKIGRGDMSAATFYAQKKLLSKLYPVTPTGVFDNDTISAVELFRKEHGLNSEGEIDECVWNELSKIGGGRSRLY